MCSARDASRASHRARDRRATTARAPLASFAPRALGLSASHSRARASSIHSNSLAFAFADSDMVRASTLGLHLTLTSFIAGLEFRAAAHPKSAVFAFAPTVFTRDVGLKAAAASATGAFAVSLVGSFLCVVGIAAALKIRDRTLRVGEKMFLMMHLALAVNEFVFRDRVKGVFPGVFVLHGASAALFHLGDDVKVPIKIPSILGRVKIPSKASSKPAKKTSSKKAPKKAPSRSSSRKSK